MKKIVLSFFLLYINTFAFSQNSWEYGPVIGIGISDVTPSSPYYEEEFKLKPGYHLGFEARKTLENAIVRGQLRYASAGSGIEGYSVSDTYLGSVYERINYLEVPIFLSLDFGKPEGFLLTLGLHGSLGLGGKQKLQSMSDEIETPIVFSSTVSDNPDEVSFKPFNTGWDFGFGIKKDNVIVDLIVGSTFEEDKNKPFIITIKGGVAIMLNHE